MGGRRVLGLVTLVALALQACPSDPSGSAAGSVGGAPEGGGDGDAGREATASGQGGAPSGRGGAPSGRSGAPSGQGGEGGRAEPYGPCDGCPCNLCGDGDLSAESQLCAEEGKLC